MFGKMKKKHTLPRVCGVHMGCEVDPNSVVIANFVKNYPKKIFGKIIKHTPVCVRSGSRVKDTKCKKCGAVVVTL